jgi:Cu-processing system permease protein
VRRIAAIALNTCREAIRDRVLYSLLFFAALILAASLVTQELTVGDQDKVVRGVAQAAIRLFSSIMAMFLGVGLVWKEIERRTIYLVVSKPTPRWMFLLGKYVGLLLTLAINLGLMVGLYVVLITFQQGFPHPSFWAFVGLLCVHLMLLTAWATFFSSFSGPTTATAFTLSIFVIGNLADDIWTFGQQASTPLVRSTSAVLYWLLPNFEVFNVQPQAAHQVFVAPSYLLEALVYGLGYTAAVLAASIAVFQRRDFR